ncbi:MAG: hypothetical protein MUP82_10105 [Candidatus Marinimicrobia bacterium]|nr:hypothetical protein [Candidatus Neomarinimicrobiota bacterium]
MSAGSGASNIGYSNINPYSTSPYVNGTSSNYAGSFSSNEIPGLPGLAGSKSNIDAAAGVVPGVCLFKGGARKLKRKIKNITRHYKKMKAGSKRMKGLKRRLRTRMASRSLSRSFSGGKRTRNRRNRRSHKQRGGYGQFQNNQPITPTYQVAGINLPASQLALANPAPYTVLPNCTNCVDNYSRFTNTGFPSRGH